MTIATTRQYPLVGTHAGFRRFSVAEYHKLIQMGMLTPDENLELIEGYLVHKMSRKPPHSTSYSRTRKKIEAILPTGWELRLQDAITLSSSEPEPDIALARGSDADYETRHPGPPDLALVVEISDSSLEADQSDKQRIYARDGVVRYWIVNLPDRRVEVYTDPQPAADPPCYATRTDFASGTSVPLVLDGTTVGMIVVDEILP
jgi:Putative restriction endonuclease